MNHLYEKRTADLRRFLTRPDEAALISSEVNIGYFTGFFHSEGYLLVTPDQSTLLVDSRYDEAARINAHGCKVVCFQTLSESLLSLLNTENTHCVYGEADCLTVKRFRFFQKKLAESHIDFVAHGKLDTHIAQQRLVKDAAELQKIAGAQAIAEQAYNEMLNFLKPGVSERALAARLEYEMKLRGAEDVSFSLITITGKKTALPHGVPSDDTVMAGDFFTCDFGAVYQGYHSDTTRTVAVGYATDEMRMVYDIVLRAQLAALTAIKPGASCADVDNTARDIIKNAGYGAYFGHSVGHGVGLDIHEMPAVSSRSDTVLRAGMVITDEPGIYLPGKFGVRIEDMLSVTENGFHNFVNLPKELLIL